MNKYIKDGKIIHATDKGYEIIYKKQGYRPFKEAVGDNSILLDQYELEVKLDALENDVVKIDYSSYSYPELKTLAKEKGINSHKMTKEELIEALQKVGE